MATENPEVSGQPGEAELPNPTFSDTDASPTSADADAIVSKLLPQLEQIIDRKVQSTKDKRFSELEKALGGRGKMLAELEELGTDVSKEVRTELRLRELEEQRSGQSPQPAQVRDDGSSTQKAAVTEAIAELRKYELSENDPGFIELLRGNYKSRAEFDLRVKGHIIGKLAPPKAANVADVTQSPATARATDKSTEALTSEYKQKVLASRGKPAEIRALKDEYVKKGVNIHEVDFS